MLNFNIFGFFQKNDFFLGGGGGYVDFVDIVGHCKIRLYFGVFSMSYRVFS